MSPHPVRPRPAPARAILGATLAALAVAGAQAQSVERPELSAGDSWVYRDTREGPALGWNQMRDEVSVSRVTASSVYFVTRQVGSAQPGRERIATPEWAVIRDVNGAETVVNRPLAFPLEPGKTWEISFTEKNPSPTQAWASTTRQYRVLGTEPVDVPAGRFNAVKIEAEGRWTAELVPTASAVQAVRSSPGGTTAASSLQNRPAQTVSGRYYSAFWYAPEVKRVVKNVEETYDSRGVLAERVSGELESFRAAPR